MAGVLTGKATIMKRNRWIVAVLGITAAIAIIITLISHVPTSAAVGPTIPPIPTEAPRGPTVPPATAGPNGTAIPPGGYRTLPNGMPVMPATNAPRNSIVGLPAIRPTVSTNDPSIPAIAAKDVRTYLAGHDVGLKVHTNGPVIVTDVQFMTTSAAKNALKDQTLPFEDTRLLCLAFLSGSFNVPSSNRATTTNSGTAIVIFDAHTGNTLMMIA